MATAEVERPPLVRRIRVHRISAIIWALTVVGLALRLVKFLHPGALYGLVGYDDGVYFGASIRLVHGSLPYHDFVFVQPPLITELMAPLAALAGHVSTIKLVAIARLFTVLVSTATIPLLGQLLRHRGAVAVTIGCALTAVHADTAVTSRAVLLEPYLAFFCVLAAVVLFDGDRLSDSRRRQVWGGVLFGLAGATKVWAIAPLALVLLLCVRRPRVLGRIAAGTAAGFLVPTLPFLIVAPTAFVREVVLSQITRQGSRTVSWFRLNYLVGADGFRHPSHLTLTLMATVLIAIALLGYWLLWTRPGRRPVPLELFAIGSAAAIVIMFYVARQFVWHYGGFFGPFLALLLALPASALGPGRRRVPFAAWLALAAIALVGLAVSAVRANTLHYWRNLQVQQIQAAIPAGTCTIDNSAALALAVDRFPTAKSCPVIVDPFGVDFVEGHGAEPPRSFDVAAVRRTWGDAFRRADNLLLLRLNLTMLPWTGPHALRPFARRTYRYVDGLDEQQLIWIRRPSSGRVGAPGR